MAHDDAKPVLVADDDAELLALIGFALRHAGFDVVGVGNGALAIETLERSSFALAILDINMPGADGFAVCERLRARGPTPVIVLSARREESDILRALELGADDYVVKPFSPRTLIARVHALLRRTQAAERTIVTAGATTLDVEQRSLRAAEVRLPLTPLETVVLRALLRAPGRVVSNERLAAEAWGRAGADERHALKQVVYRLRRKLDAQPALAGALETTRGAGYRWLGDDARAGARSDA
ncbi:MAG TPA: response regulator transcription factor [Gammaproteobacteria bacterium]|nr:response regulator transcription factor [Gammaproteobacteria bacterium]